MTGSRHAARIAALMVVAAALLASLASHAEVMFNDGLRYIGQAQRIDQGAWKDGLLKAVDHPMYPLGIATAHRLIGGETPQSWERSGQLASAFAAVLWIIPFYLIAVELYGGASAWLAALLALVVPLTGHVFGDVLSESTFLLFWTWGVWTALKFLGQGRFVWLPATIGFAALAYLSRPEGLLLPVALVTTLGAVPLLRSTRMNWPRWWRAVAFLVIGPALILTPYIAIKGGLGTKPAIARLLGTAPKSGAKAVERQRPLVEGQSTATTYLIAVREVSTAIKDGVTLPLLPFILAGLYFSWPPGERSRAWMFIVFILLLGFLALVRLHATGGYCTPRHAMIIVYPLIALAAHGLHGLVGKITLPGRWFGLDEGRYEIGPALWGVLLVGLGLFYAPETLAPINQANAGYRSAGEYLAKQVQGDERTVDLTGLSLFYASKPGYTFEDLHAAPGDTRLRWVVVREAHLRGDWPYCERIRELVGDRAPQATFPDNPKKGQAKVFVFEIEMPAAAMARKDRTSR